jgi:glucose 1-dehydrogenase
MKVAVVTGGAKGVGRGISLALAARGWAVVANYNATPEVALRTKEEIEAAGGNFLLVKADVSVPEDVRALMAAAVERFGRIDALVNNAALQRNLMLFQYSMEDYDRVMDVNLGGYLRCAQAALPQLKEHHGRIVNISSVHAGRPTGFDPVYAMTKAGIRMLSHEMALEFAPHGIFVNTVELGVVDSGAKTGAAGGWQQARRPTPHPVEPYPHYLPGRVCRPEEVGALVAWILGDDNTFMTGSAVRLDGGLILT